MRREKKRNSDDGARESLSQLNKESSRKEERVNIVRKGRKAREAVELGEEERASKKDKNFFLAERKKKKSDVACPPEISYGSISEGLEFWWHSGGGKGPLYTDSRRKKRKSD